MFAGINAGNMVLNSEEVEHIFNQIIEVFAQHSLNYDASRCILNMVEDRLGQLYFLKISSN